MLVANLLPVTDFPARGFRADTHCRFAWQVWGALREHSATSPAEWLLHDESLYSLYNLKYPPWPNLCRASTTQPLDLAAYATSDDRHKLHIFRLFLSVCLDKLLRLQGIRYSKAKEYYYFQATPDFSERKVGGLSVFKGYASKKNAERTAYYRHRAASLSFVRLDRTWYLEISPSYHFTQDGFRLSRYYEERLSGIKALERQNKVHLRQLRLWEQVLRQIHLGTPPEDDVQQRQLFDAEAEAPACIEPYAYLTFAPLVQFETDSSVPETAWLPSDDIAEGSGVSPADDAGGLFA
jgi:hypothetical protein